jgi:hypothetical protein
MKTLNINQYSNFLFKFGNNGEINKIDLYGLKKLLDDLYYYEMDDDLNSLQITPVPCLFNEYDFMWFNSDLELIGETA